MAVDIAPEPDSFAGNGAGRVAGALVARPELLERVGAARVTVVSASAGSGKSVLLRSWLEQAGLASRAAQVQVGRDERDPQRFWMAVAAALRDTDAGAELVREVTAGPALDGWVLVERLLTDLAELDGPLWLLVDDVHELDSSQVLAQLELLIMRAPAGLRFVLASRHDVRLGLHRLRLDGELTEIREQDLRFALEEATELFETAGLSLPPETVLALHERTEGWAAGLRLAALALAGHPDPEGFAADFSGSERTVAEYLMAEVLDRQTDDVRRLLIRTSILDRVNGELADLLTGDEGGERVLHELERANAFTVALDASRSWFRYHQQFAEMLRLELRYDEPAEVAGLHRTASGWLATRGYPVEAVRHAQAARDWDTAACLLADHGLALRLDGQAAMVGELLAGFPPGYLEEDAGLAVQVAAGELSRGSLEEAERYLERAATRLDSVPEDRRGQVRVWLGAVSVQVAHHRGDLETVAEETQRFVDLAEGLRSQWPGLVTDMSAMAMINLGSTEFWVTGQDAEHHLERGLALARSARRPFLEFVALALKSAADVVESFERAAEGAASAVELARRHGWSSEPAFGVACMVLGSAMFWRGQLDEAGLWIARAERTVRAETHPTQAKIVRELRGLLELARGQHAEALAAFQSAGALTAGKIAAPQHCAATSPALLIHALVRAGDNDSAEQVLSRLSQPAHEEAEPRIAAAALRLAQGNAPGALAELAPVLDGPAPANWLVMAWILEARARDAVGEPMAADDAIERALDLAEPDGLLLPFLLYPAPGLLERRARRATAHAALLAQVRDLIAEGTARPSPSAGQAQPLLEAPSESELRVLRYLPTHLSAPEIARELSVSPNTVRTHVRHLYEKLGTHARAETVERARDLGLLAPASPGARRAAPSERASSRSSGPVRYPR